MCWLCTFCTLALFFLPFNGTTANPQTNAPFGVTIVVPFPFFLLFFSKKFILPFSYLALLCGPLYNPSPFVLSHVAFPLPPPPTAVYARPRTLLGASCTSAETS